MSDTLARLLGPEGELEHEMMVPGCPMHLEAAVPPRISDILAGGQADVVLPIETVEYVREFVVPGGEGRPLMATYRRKLQFRR